MKTPDKIYVTSYNGEAFSSKWTTIPFRDFENTEYIRKDALLEWAKKEREFIDGLFMEGDASFYDGQDDAYFNLIAKLQSL